jgi:hypothetical protein
MRRILFNLLLIISTLMVNSCKDKYEDCTSDDYNNCFTDRPEIGEVEIKISTTNEQPTVLVKLYEGNFEDKQLIWEKTFRNPTQSIYLDVETPYSFTAYYTRDGKEILAVDGGTINVSSYQACEYKCYEADLLKIDLSLD